MDFDIICKKCNKKMCGLAVEKGNQHHGIFTCKVCNAEIEITVKVTTYDKNK